MEKILEVNNLAIDFISNKKALRAVDNVSFHVNAGEVVGVVGESGSGKSVTTTSILKLLPSNGRIANGEIIYKGQNLADYSEKAMREIRGNEISMIFQDPMTSLNPVYTVGNQLQEAILLHQKLTKKEAKNKAIELLEKVGITQAESKLTSYPYEFSGGMRQRVMIAMAIASNPALIIADEPTTALDVTVQAQILKLLQGLQEELKTSVILITHDLEVVRDMADRIVIMYAGQVVETSDAATIFTNPLHPYTKLLMKAIPTSNKAHGRIPEIEGSVPALEDLSPDECRFQDRIPWIAKDAHEKNPQLREVAPGHWVRCTCYKHFHYKDLEG